MMDLQWNGGHDSCTGLIQHEKKKNQFPYLSFIKYSDIKTLVLTFQAKID